MRNSGSGVVVTVQYSPDCVSWARLMTTVLGWLVEEHAGANETSADGFPGTLSADRRLVSGTGTPPIVSPQWGVLATPGVRWGGVLINP
jgi:hypothetical protein